MKGVVTVCPCCTSGCKISLMADNDKIVRAEVAQEKTNQGTLRPKGCYGWDFINDIRILTPCLEAPIIRRQRGDRPESVFWDKAFDYVTSCLSVARAKYGPSAVQTTGSSRNMDNEASYVAQKFARAIISTNDVDCCARV